MSEWSDGTRLEAIADEIRGAKRVMTFTHVKPDGDAVGSALALARTYQQLGASACCVFEGALPAWLDEIAGDTPWVHLQAPLSADDPAPAPVGAPADEPDLIAVVDTGARSQLPATRDWLERRQDRLVAIDHHLRGDADLFPRRLIDTSVASATTIVARLALALLPKAPNTPDEPRTAAHLPRDIAEPLYLGLATDTGWFRHSNVTPAVFRLAADLVQAGAQHTALFQTVEQTDTVARLALLQRSLASLRFNRERTFAVMRLAQRDFDAAGAAPTDSGGFVDAPLAVASVRVSAMLTEDADAKPGAPRTKISLRAKAGPKAVDVNKVASALGGGGHAAAAGARVDRSLEDTERALIDLLEEHMR